MKNIHSWDHLREFGIEWLTGEADALGYRTLFDVTAKGKAIIEKYLDAKLTLAPNWNSGREGDPHIGSIMLERGMFEPLAVFALLENGAKSVWLVGDEIYGAENAEDEEQLESIRELWADKRFRRIGPSNHPREGYRNVHQMSGRAQ